MLLARLNELQLNEAAGRFVEILVIDNSPDGQAQAAALDPSSKERRVPVRYVWEPRRGVAAARNAALDAARGAEFIAFIDDDEEPEPQWLDALLRAQRDFDADVVCGAVLPRFTSDAPQWALDGRFYERRRYPTGTILMEGRTCNVLVRMESINRVGLRFDEALSMIGGEDTMFFERMRVLGNRIVACDEAVVHEHYGSSRLRLGWLLKRWYRTGNIDARLYQMRHPGRLSAPTNLARGLSRVLGGAGVLCAMALSARGRHRIVAPLYTVCRGMGIIGSVLSLDYQEYQVTHGT